MLRLILFFLFVILFSLVEAQSLSSSASLSSYKFGFYNYKNGLSGNGITALAQDQSGYLWIGTTNGLTRFDGSTTKIYRSLQGYNTISNNDITNLIIDNNKFLWISYGSGGIDRLDLETDEIKYFGIADGIPDAEKRFFYFDKDHLLWMGTRFDGLYCFDVSDNELKLVIKLDLTKFFPSWVTDKKGNSIYSMLEDKSGTFWLATRDGLYKYDKAGNKLEPIREKYIAEWQWRDDLFRDIILSGDSVLWLTSWGGGLSSYSIKKNTWRNFKFEQETQSFTKNIINQCRWKSDHELWITTYASGLGVFNTITNEFEFLKKSSSEKRPTGRTEELLIDRDQNIWIGSFEGLYKISSAPVPFTFVDFNVGKSDNGDLYLVKEIFYDSAKQKKIYATYYAEGLYIEDLKKKTRIYYSVPKDPKSEQFERVTDLFYSGGDSLWVLSYDYIQMFDLKNEKWIHLKQPLDKLNNFLPEKTFSKMICDHQGNFWFSTITSGVFKLEHKTMEYKQFCDSSIISNRIEDLAEDRFGRIWLATDKGLSVIDSKTDLVKNYRDVDLRSKRISIIVGVVSDRLGNIWAASSDNGLFQFTFPLKDSIVVNDFKNDEILSAPVYNLSIGPKGMLWFNSQTEIHQMDPEDKSIRSFGESDGVKDYNVQAISFSFSDHNIFIGTYKGYYQADLSFIKKSTKPIRVVINNFRVLGESFPIRMKDGKMSAYLNSEQNSFSVEFGAIEFDKAEQIKFAYRLVGFDKKWNESKSRKFINYTNLPGGRYVLQIKANNADGIWNEEAIEMTIRIRQAFWRTGWFCACVGLCIYAIGTSINVYRTRTRRSKNEVEAANQQKISALELTGLRAQMNPHFIFNSLNAINRFVVKANPIGATEYIVKFARLMRLTLEGSREHRVLIQKELELLQLYLQIEQLRYQYKFDFKINVDPELDITIEIPSMMIQPYVENSIWHGLVSKTGHGLITIDISYGNGYLKCVVEDNGVGRFSSKLTDEKSSIDKQSLGMQITADRLRTMNYAFKQNSYIEIFDLKGDAGESEGTRVILMLQCE